jgi:release factor glutamine methyltransferase
VILHKAITGAAQKLIACSESPRLDAELLLAVVLSTDRTGILRRHQDLLDPAHAAAYEALLARRLAGEPVAYLCGRREFWSLPLYVDCNVLVPRPETELLVEQALAALPPARRCRVLDLGTGSGAIALAIATERTDADILAVDVSAGALAVAARNAAALGTANVKFRQSNWFSALHGEQFDLIVCNPPYVAAGDAHLAALRHEPALALTPGPTGLEAFELIAAAAPAQLSAGGVLLFEHGATQAEAVNALLAGAGFGNLYAFRDYAGAWRVTRGTHLST